MNMNNIEKYIDNRKERCCDLHSYIYIIIEFNIYLLYYISIIIIKQKEREECLPFLLRKYVYIYILIS